jgi:general secretion pathway protein G
MKKLTRLVNVSDRSGFTLVELLIVVIILAVLAAIVVPQFSSSTDEAREAALRSSLLEMRNSIEIYFHQHSSHYPGEFDESGTSTASTAANVNAAFLAQLTRYTDINGQTATVRDATFRFGPYLKRDDLPTSPIDGSNTVTYVIVGAANVGDLGQPGAPPAGSTGWWFDVVSGKLIAYNPDSGIDGTAYATW